MNAAMWIVAVAAYFTAGFLFAAKVYRVLTTEAFETQVNSPDWPWRPIDIPTGIATPAIWFGLLWPAALIWAAFRKGHPLCRRR